MDAQKTLDYLRGLDKNHFSPADVAPYLEMNPMTVRLLARDGQLDCPTIIAGTRVKFPKAGFIQAAERGLI